MPNLFRPLLFTMIFLVGLLALFVEILSDRALLWAASPFDEVVRTPHNLLPLRATGLDAVCLSCHTDNQVLKTRDQGNQTPGEPSPDLKVTGGPLAVRTSGPRWSPETKEQAFPLISSVWSLKTAVDRRPLGSSSACLGCHDGALAEDVHGEKLGLDQLSLAGDRPADHPTSVQYPRRLDGIYATERPTLTSLRYWSIADRTDKGVAMPTGPVSIYFQPSGYDPGDPMVGASVVRTSYGMIHCDSCHNPHVNRHPPFLRMAPEDLCFACHDR